MRQYIGARYVPKFATPYEWQTNTAYEALTVVSYLGNSYTSKKPVPAGIEPTNSEYWAMTGNYSQGIAEIKEDIEKLKNNKQFGSFLPSVYRGDYFTNNSYPQSCCVYNDDVWCFNPAGDTRLGTVRRFSRSQNKLLAQYNDVRMDHANSACYWEGRGVCVAADYYVNNESNVGVPTIYLYAPDFSSYTEIPTNGTCQGVSFDHVRNKMYYMNALFEIYEYNSETSLFDLVGKVIPHSNTRFLQGIAINDGKYIITDISGAYCSGELQRGNMYPTVYGITEYGDVERRFLYHEAEDMEYDENGNLWGTRFYRYASGALDCFVVNYLSDYSGVFTFDPWTGREVYPWNITEASINSFKLPWGALRNVQQIEGLLYNPSDAVRINTLLEEPYNVILTQDLNIDIRDGGEWRVNALQLRFGSYVFYQNDNSSKLTIASKQIMATDARELSFVGPGRLITNNDDEPSVSFVRLDTCALLGRFRLCPKNANGVAIKWASHTPPDGSLMIGDSIALDY